MMRVKRVFALLFLIFFMCGTGLAQQMPVEFTGFPEVTDFGSFLCDVWFWRGEPPCLKESSPAASYINYPTRDKAKIIVDTFLIQGLYPEATILSFFGSLATGAWRPNPDVPIGDYWDSMYFAFEKLDCRIEAKKALLDITFDRGWAQGKFGNERYKALITLAKERVITLREYKNLVEYIKAEIAKPEPDMKWINALVYCLSSFREWNDELLPIFRQVFDILQPGNYTILLQAFIDFESKDDGEFLIRKVTEAHVKELADAQLVIRAAYVLDYEIVKSVLSSYRDTNKTITPEMKEYAEKTLARIDFYGNWEITDTKDTLDAGLKNEIISFRMGSGLDESEDEVTFSMPMQICDPIEMKPIGMDETPLTNWISFDVSPKELIFHIENPIDHTMSQKVLSIDEGKGREEGKFFWKFMLEEKDAKGQPKYGFIQVEKIS